MLKLLLLLGVCAMFAGLGYIINTKNAKYYLAGYWNLKAEDKEKVDLIGFLKFFKRFHLGLAVSTFSIGMIGGLLFTESVVLVVILAIITLAYVFMATYSSKYWKGLKEK
jgi:hypothetical protein